MKGDTIMIKRNPFLMGTIVAAVLLIAALCSTAWAQTDTSLEDINQSAAASSDNAPSNTDSSNSASDSVFPHLREGRFWISGQMNFIYQTHPPFAAPYSGANSMTPNYEKAISRVLTVYTGMRLNGSSEVLLDFEEAGGSGLSQALGLAGFSNLDVVRNPTLSKSPYLARVEVHRVFGLGGQKTEFQRGPMSNFSELPERRIDVYAGKFSTVDFFDLNAVGSDSHLQFMNWSTAQNGAYDYAADTRGYTWGTVVEYQQKGFAIRAGEMLMPKVANGMEEVWNLRKAHAENFEFELHRGLLPKRQGTIRLLTFVNHANMGVYSEAVAQYQAGITKVPDITNHPWRTTVKYGFGVNFEQPVSHNFTAYARWGWNNGKTESFAYTEVDSTVSVGLGVDGHQWHRGKDRAGVAFTSNAISKAHQNYLADGGLGFIIGDGGLNYGRETIVESYYTLHIWRGLYAGPDLQHINNPAYNRDRGPVLIPGFRLHAEL